MAQTTVGIRDLKAQLSHYLRRVASGDTIVITDRGKPVGQIMPVADDLDERMRRLVESGGAAWNGRKPKPVVPVERNPGARNVSDLLLEDRD